MRFEGECSRDELGARRLAERLQPSKGYSWRLVKKVGEKMGVRERGGVCSRAKRREDYPSFSVLNVGYRQEGSNPN